MLDFERSEWALGRRRVAGIDEAGRGPLAGPVFAAAVIFEPVFAEREGAGLLRGLTDSKKLSPGARDRFFALLTARPEIVFAIAEASREEIDRLNIWGATRLAMRRAAEALRPAAEAFLVDGPRAPDLPAPATPIIGGDGRSLSIAAASVLAKVARDRRMTDVDRQWPGYGFARHKGYGTRTHLEALARLGPCPEHRRSFAPVAAAVGGGERGLKL